jgi:hypothetical protein
MIVQYLEDESFTTSMMTIQDEANVKIFSNAKHRNRIRRLQASILGNKPPYIYLRPICPCDQCWGSDGAMLFPI